MKRKLVSFLKIALVLGIVIFLSLIFSFLKNNQPGKKDNSFLNNKNPIQEEVFPSSKETITLKSFKLSESNLLQGKCQIKKVYEEVQGSSMTGIVESGGKVIVLENYYQCHPIQRNEIIIYQHPNGQRLIKVVKALPQDSWSLKEKDSGYQIVVNNQVLTNAQQIPYLIPKEKSAVLRLYTKDYPTIPENTYLILGNNIEGSLDSTRFGLVDKKEIIGKVILLKSF